MKKEHIKPVIIIFLIAIIARVLFQLCIYQPFADRFNWQHFPGQFNMHSDDRYDEIARNLLAGKGYVSPLGKINEEEPQKSLKNYPNLKRPPVYPLILVLQFYLFGDGYWINLLINIIYQSSVCIILYYLTLMIFNDLANKKKIAIISSLIWALYPLPMLSAMAPITEAIYELFIVLFGYFFYKYYKFKKTQYFVYASILLLIMTLTRPITIFFPLYFLIITLFSREFSFRNKMKQIIIMFSIFIVGVSPWIYRAYTYTGTIVPLVTYDITYLGEDMKDIYWGPTSEKMTKGYIGKLKDEIERPLYFISNSFIKLLRFWYYGHSTLKSILNALVQIPLLLLAVLGLWWAKKQKYLMYPLLIIICYFWFAYGSTHAISRYSQPMMILLSPFAAIGILNFINKAFKIVE